MIRRWLPLVGAIYVILAAQPATAQPLTITLTAEQPVYIHALTPGIYHITADTGVTCDRLTVDAYIVARNPAGETIAQDDDGNHSQNNCLSSKLDRLEIPGDGYTLHVFGCCGRPYGTLTLTITELEAVTTTTEAATTTTAAATTTVPPETTTTAPNTTTTTATTTTLETVPPETTAPPQPPIQSSSTIATTTTSSIPRQTLPTTTSEPPGVPIITDSTNAPITTENTTNTSTSSTIPATIPPTVAATTVTAEASNALAPGVTPQAQRAIVAASLTMLMAAPTSRRKS